MILITGGAGFIGSVLVKKFNDMGRTDLVVVDRFDSNDKWLNLRGLKFAEFIHADELFEKQNQYILNSIQAIFHMGACSDTTEKNVDFLMKNNTEYSKSLFHLAAEKEIPFIYASSAATYGQGELGYSDDHEIVSKLLPLNPYGYSKQCFDEWVLKQKRFPKFWFGLKFFNVYGPHEYHKESMRSVVYHAFEQVKKDGEVKLFMSLHPDYKDGEQKRDFIYVKDAVAAMISLYELHMKNPMQNYSGIFNMGTGIARTFNDLAQAVFTACDLSPHIKYINMPEGLAPQYQYFTEANMHKFSTLLPDFKFSSLEEGVKDYVQNFLRESSPYLHFGKNYF
ncbi:MAG: ADP-glyceromanno-heptose 6-epimerase [Bacteriovoracaceae bacterium]|nr:ADP-glyceromanno-heptose 6-epimerase [Bacteriovoracaceae bacterium]